MRAGALIAIVMATACGVSRDDAKVAPGPATSAASTGTYAIGGTVDGLSGSLSLKNRGGDALVVTHAGAFRFPTPLTSGALYSVGVSAQPIGQTCIVEGGDEEVTADVTNIAVSCTSADATIASLHLTQGGHDVPIAPAFRSDVSAYRADLFALTGSTVDVMVATSQPGASWSVNGAVATDGKVTVAVPFTGTIDLDLAIESPSRDHTSHYSVVVGGVERAIHTDAPADALFGRSVATDGTRIVVAEPWVPFEPNVEPLAENILGKGRVHVYAPSADGWSEEATLDAVTPSAPDVATGYGDQFGVALALAGDLLVVGAPGAGFPLPDTPPTDRAIPTSGAAFVYRHEPSGWIRIAVLAGRTPTRSYARNVATDGTRIAVSTTTGATDLYLVDGDSVTFETALYARNGGPIVFAGERVVSTDCQVAAEFDGPNGFTGTADIFVSRYDGSAWNTEPSPALPTGASTGRCSSALAASGTDLVIGAPFDTTTLVGVAPVPVPEPPEGLTAQPRGAAYVYARGAAGWTATAVAKQTDPSAFGTLLQDDQWPRYGFDVALEGDTMLVGAPAEPSAATGFDGDEADTTMSPSAGAAYLLTRSGGTWQPRVYMKPSDTSAGLHYGTSVALAGGLAVVGSLHGVYIYRVP